MTRWKAVIRRRAHQRARTATRALFARRSSKNLVGGHIDVTTGYWSHVDSGIGTYIDSYYEYLLKSYILFREPEDYVMFLESYKGALTHLNKNGWYVEACRQPNPKPNPNMSQTRFPQPNDTPNAVQHVDGSDDVAHLQLPPELLAWDAGLVG